MAKQPRLDEARQLRELLNEVLTLPNRGTWHDHRTHRRSSTLHEDAKAALKELDELLAALRVARERAERLEREIKELRQASREASEEYLRLNDYCGELLSQQSFMERRLAVLAEQEKEQG